MSGLFGTDGIRGAANREPLTPETLARIGRALGATLLEAGGLPRVLVGRDTRRSGSMVGGAVVAGLLSAGVGVTSAGVLPTPAVARLARSGRYGLGVVISASHNPAGDNGVKVFLRDGRKADPDFEAAVEGRIASGDGTPGAEVGELRFWHGAKDSYLDSLLEEFSDLDLSGVKVVLDCAHGATCPTAPLAFERLGAKVVSLNVAPTGKNINRRCGAMHPRVVARAVGKNGADVGVTFDGDGDRAMFADETGRVLDGDATMAILARDMIAHGRLPHRTVVATVMSNVGLERTLREVGVRLVRTAVGDRNVVEKMDEGGFRLGGEQSGHVLVKKGGRLVGDGLETALHVMRARDRTGAALSEMGRCFTRYPQLLVNVRVREKPDLATIPAVARAIREVEEDLGDDGRIVVRYSGTEPLARVMAEGPDRGRTRRAAGRIADAIEREIGKDS